MCCFLGAVVLRILLDLLRGRINAHISKKTRQICQRVAFWENIREIYKNKTTRKRRNMVAVARRGAFTIQFGGAAYFYIQKERLLYKPLRYKERVNKKEELFYFALRCRTRSSLQVSSPIVKVMSLPALTIVTFSALVTSPRNCASAAMMLSFAGSSFLTLSRCVFF